MNDLPTVASEVGRNAPLTAVAAYLTFIQTHGPAIVTTLAIVYAVMQMVLRAKEHRAIMKKNEIKE